MAQELPGPDGLVRVGIRAVGAPETGRASGPSGPARPARSARSSGTA